MKKMIALKFIPILFLFSTGVVSAVECPHNTTNACIDWVEQHDDTINTWHDGYWSYTGRLQPNNELVEIKIKLLGSDDSWHDEYTDTLPNSVHVMNVPGGQHYYFKTDMQSTSIMYGVGRRGDEVFYNRKVKINFTAYNPGQNHTHNVELMAESEISPITGEYGHNRRFRTEIDGVATTIRYPD
jgi:hypothetical protein